MKNKLLPLLLGSTLVLSSCSTHYNTQVLSSNGIESNSFRREEEITFRLNTKKPIKKENLEFKLARNVNNNWVPVAAYFSKDRISSFTYQNMGQNEFSYSFTLKPSDLTNIPDAGFNQGYWMLKKDRSKLLEATYDFLIEFESTAIGSGVLNKLTDKDYVGGNVFYRE